MNGYCAHSTSPHTNLEQATTHGKDGFLQTPLAKPQQAPPPTENNFETAKNAALTEQLMWYQSNRHTLLAHHDHALLHNIDMSTLHTMPSRHKREWIRHLTAAKIANTQELALKKTNQHSLFRYMKPVNAQPTANPGTQPPPHMHNRVHSRYRTQPGKTLARQ